MVVVRSLLLALVLSAVSVALAAPDSAETPAAKDAKAGAAKAKAKSSPKDKAKKAPAGEEKPAADATANPAESEFAKEFGEWKKLVAKLYQIRDRFENDPQADKKALEKEYAEILAKAEKQTVPLSAAAEKAYLADPNKNPELNNFLLANLTGFVVGDDFEKAAHLADILIEHKYQSRELDLLAGMAFFATNDFDRAETYLKAAKENGTINENGERYLSMIDKYKEMWKKEQELRAKEDERNNLPKVKLSTSKGDIVLVLFEDQAPIATANFINLIENKFYNNLSFHRVIGGFMAQGGDPKGDGTGGPGYTIPCECRNENHRDHFRGTLSMAHAGPDTGGSQFFLTFVPTPNLDGKHTVFGRVVEGVDVLAKLKRVQPGDGNMGDIINSATVLSKRPHKYEPVKLFDKK